ncbi:MAG: hypothetical protein AVDCRST_MAG85-2272, partial [uncultured Solirubrobacteraceae bacterium]
ENPHRRPPRPRPAARPRVLHADPRLHPARGHGPRRHALADGLPARPARRRGAARASQPAHRRRGDARPDRHAHRQGVRRDALPRGRRLPGDVRRPRRQGRRGRPGADGALLRDRRRVPRRLRQPDPDDPAGRDQRRLAGRAL